MTMYATDSEDPKSQSRFFYALTQIALSASIIALSFWFVTNYINTRNVSNEAMNYIFERAKGTEFEAEVKRAALTGQLSKRRWVEIDAGIQTEKEMKRREWMELLGKSNQLINQN